LLYECRRGHPARRAASSDHHFFYDWRLHLSCPLQGFREAPAQASATAGGVLRIVKRILRRLKSRMIIGKQQ
jgi:hypothetical protein